MTSTDKRWVVVTGAASGIGAGIARSVAAAGYGVILVGQNQSRLDRVAGAIPGSRTLVADVSDPASGPAIENIAREVGNAWGLVNCAGISAVKHFLLMSEEEWTRIFRVNLEGTYRATQAMARVLAENGGGAIVNISSLSGVNPPALQTAYAASKAGMNGFTTSLAFDLGPFDITANVISPGIVRTPIWEQILEEESAETGVPADDLFVEHLKPIPLGRPQTEDDMGDLVVFLLGPSARNISGESIKVTGGMTAVVFDHVGGAKEYRDSLAD